MRTKPFYHITSPDVVPSILGDGLRGGLNPRNRGETLAVPSVFVLTTNRPDVMDAVATNQIWPFQDVGEYAVLRINPAGVTGRVLVDRVAELTANSQRVIQQEVIPPGSVEHVENRRIDYPGEKLQKLQGKVLRRQPVAPDELDLLRRYAPWLLAMREALATSPVGEADSRGDTRTGRVRRRRPRNGT